MCGLIDRLSAQPARKQLAGGCINEKKRYAAHIGVFLANPSRGEKLAHRCLFNKRSRACLALYTAVDIAYQILRREQAASHNSIHRLAAKQAADQIERDLMRIRGFLRPVFLDRRSFITQFANGGDIDDEHAGSAYGRLGGAELHSVMADATYRAERFLQIYSNCSLTWAVMLAVEPEMQMVQDKLMPQNARSLEKNAFIGSIFRLEWKKPVAQMALHVIAKHIILILNVPASIRVPVVQQPDIEQLRNDGE